MESLRERGALPVRRVQVSDGLATDVGNLHLKPGFVIGGVLRFEDGTVPSPNFMITLSRISLEDVFNRKWA